MIRFINVQTTKEKFLIPHQMIDDCVFIANTITSKSKSMVRLINMTDNNLIIKTFHLGIKSFNDYNVVKLKNNPKDNDKKETLTKLSKNFSEFVDEELKTLCSEFIDILH